jgi:hypothetical protein
VASLVLLVVGNLVLSPSTPRAQERAYTLAIRNHRFEPGESEIPAGKKVALVVRNFDPTTEGYGDSLLDRSTRSLICEVRQKLAGIDKTVTGTQTKYIV